MWLSLSSSTKRAPGIQATSLRPWSSVTIWSSRAWNTSVGHCTSAHCAFTSTLLVDAQVLFGDVGRHRQTHAFADLVPRRRVGHRRAHQLREEDLPER